MFLTFFNSHGRYVENEAINLNEAMYLLETQQTMEEEHDNFIGFTPVKHPHATIQFIRQDVSSWIIDIPTFQDKEYTGSYNSEISHSVVLIMVKEFFETSEFQKSIIDRDYAKMKEICEKRWGVSYSFELGSD